MKRYYVFFTLLVVFTIGVTALQTTMSRGYKTDAIKESDLTIIQESISTYANTNHKLPQNTADTKPYSPVQGKLSDYSYRISDYNKYSLCAVFSHDRVRPANSYNTLDARPEPQYHKKGKVCLDYTESAVPRPAPLFSGLTSSQSCVVGTRDPHSLLTSASWQSFDASSKTITFRDAGQTQTLRWCTTLTAYALNGYQISLQAIPLGQAVSISLTNPATINPNGTITTGAPYVTEIKEITATPGK